MPYLVETQSHPSPRCRALSRAPLTCSNFLHATAPRIAYANPSLPFLVSRIPMPFKPSKSPYKPNKDPNAPTTEEEIARAEEAQKAAATLTISFRESVCDRFGL